MFPCCQEVIGASSDPALVLFHLSDPVCSVGPCTQRSRTASLQEFVSFTSLVLWLCQYHQPLLCSLVEILPAAVLCQAQSLPVVPRPCTPGMFFPSLSEACIHKCKTCYFSKISPSPKRALLLSHGVSCWGASCSMETKFQNKIKIFRGCSCFPAV